MNEKLEVKNLSLERYNELLEKEKDLDNLSKRIIISRDIVSCWSSNDFPIKIYSKDGFKDVVARFLKLKDNIYVQNMTDARTYRKLLALAEKDMKKLKADLNKATRKKWWKF